MSEINQEKISDFEANIREGNRLTSVKISEDFYGLCKKNNISFTEAMRVGISMLLAEKGIKEYDNRLNLYRKMRKYQLIAQEASQKCTELENHLEKLEDKSEWKEEIQPA